MLRALIIFTCLAAAIAAPASYDQRQDGELNVRADVQNVVFLIAIPQKLPLPIDILDGLVKFKHNGREAQDRSDVHTMEAFVEPSTPYRVEIGPDGSARAEGDGRAAEVVIASRRRDEAQGAERDELKLLGAVEQCGPERERDPVTLTCRLRAATPDTDTAPDAAADTAPETAADAAPETAPQVIPAS